MCCIEDLCGFWTGNSARLLQCLASILWMGTLDMQCQYSWHRCSQFLSYLTLSALIFTKASCHDIECSRSMVCKVKHTVGKLAQHRPREHGHKLHVCSRVSQLMTCRMYKSPQTRLGVLPWQEPVPHASLSCVKRYSLQRNCNVIAASATQTACMLVPWSQSPSHLPALHDTWDQFTAPPCNQQQLF